jgi:hypothetical protein
VAPKEKKLTKELEYLDAGVQATRFSETLAVVKILAPASVNGFRKFIYN